MDGTHFSPKSKSGSCLYLTSKNIQNGIIDLSNISYISEEEHKQIYKRCPVLKNDVLLTKDGVNTGNCAINNLDFEFSLLSSVAVLRVNQSLLNHRFLYQLVLSEKTQRIITGAISGQAITRITLEKIGNFSVWVTNLLEQQKIADCLTSIADRITAETQKLATLKAHKKGLMQQLFPAEGETLPKLRFPEFRDSGEWKEYSIAKLVKENILFAPKDGNHGNLHPKSSDYVEIGIPFVMANDLKNGAIDFSKCTHITKELADSLQKGFAKEGDVLLTHKGTVGQVALIKKIEFPYLMLTPQVTYYRIKDKSKFSSKFLAALFTSESFQSFLKAAAGGGTRAYIGITEQVKLKITVTTNILEQQKIADCLTSIDEAIAAQTQKIATLKTHKKGLMQQLFPNTK
jgi:restriction endonuclease S subunit